MEVVAGIVLVGVVIASVVALINWIARRTYPSSDFNQVVMFFVLWCTTTLIGAIYYAVAVNHYRNKRGTSGVAAPVTSPTV